MTIQTTNPMGKLFGALPPVSLGRIDTGQVYHGDFLVMAKDIPDASVNIIIADPPYNTSGKKLKIDRTKGWKGRGGEWSKTNQAWDQYDVGDYIAFTFAWLGEAKRILAPTGSIWIHGTYHCAGIINTVMQCIGITILNEVVWYKRNSVPNLSGRRLTASHETILWGAVSKKYRFNYAHSKHGHFSNDGLKLPGKQMRTVWDITNNNRLRAEHAFGRHPTQKPVCIARRLIQLSSGPGEIMLAPFAGSGTECVAAQQEGLHYIGFEIEKKYVKIARNRLNN